MITECHRHGKEPTRWIELLNCWIGDGYEPYVAPFLNDEILRQAIVMDPAIAEQLAEHAAKEAEPVSNEKALPDPVSKHGYGWPRRFDT
jgi:hypothetical protein